MFEADLEICGFLWTMWFIFDRRILFVRLISILRSMLKVFLLR